MTIDKNYKTLDDELVLAWEKQNPKRPTHSDAQLCREVCGSTLEIANRGHLPGCTYYVEKKRGGKLK